MAVSVLVRECEGERGGEQKEGIKNFYKRQEVRLDAEVY